MAGEREQETGNREQKIQTAHPRVALKQRRTSMANERDYRELKVWQKAIVLTRNIYQITQKFPDAERFGLVSQMRRAAVSVPSNIAEGNARQSAKDYLRFLVTARGSLAELETQLIIATDLSILSDPAPIMEAVSEVKRMLQGLIQSLHHRRRSE